MKKREPAKCVFSGDIEDLSHVLKILCDMNRLRIMCLLFEGEKCVCDIEQQLLLSQPLVSHHLGVLREAGFVSVRRKGTWSYYSLVRERIDELNHLFDRILGRERFPENYPSREECLEVEGGTIGT
ncbi:MAG: helix-turn-helix transcriptional regulator [Actinobacteria bacterium]|nr:helix-turn-helix transcriptional regulator [Actinomycetota bacterium]